MHQSFVATASPKPLSKMGYNVLCFYFHVVSTMRRKCRDLIDLDKHCCVVKKQTAGENCHGFAS